MAESIYHVIICSGGGIEKIAATASTLDEAAKIADRLRSEGCTGIDIRKVDQ